MMNNTNAVDFINKLEGYKTAIKSVHWAMTSNAEHLYCDGLHDSLCDYQDNIVEDLSFTYGRLDISQIFPATFIFESLEQTVRSILEDVIMFRQGVEDQNSPYDFGVLSITDDFIHSLNQSGFRSQLS